jgi:hypothetical protein
MRREIFGWREIGTMTFDAAAAARVRRAGGGTS